MNTRRLSLGLILILVVVITTVAISAVWMLWWKNQSINGEPAVRNLSSVLESASALADAAIEREKAMLIRESQVLAQNTAIRQLLYNARRRSLTSATIITNASELRSTRIETAAIIYYRFPLIILSASPALAHSRPITDSSTMARGIQNAASWVDLRDSDRLLVGGMTLRDVADSCYLVVAMSLDSTLLLRKEQIRIATNQWQAAQSALASISFIQPLALSLLMVGLSLTVVMKLNSSLKDDLSDLHFALKQVESHNLDYHMAHKPNFAETEHLLEDFNSMADQLAARQHRMVFLEKVSAWRDIAQRMAHEIKNPLTPIQLTVEQLRDSYSGTDHRFQKTLTASVEMILEEIENLRLLTKEFSDFARLPALSFQPVNVSALLKETASMYGNTPIQTDVPDDIELEADPDALKRVVINLIDNARLAISSLPHGKIIIRMIAEDEKVNLDVSDNGVGIPVSHIGRIFDPYFSTHSTGIGLGLAIVKSIVEEHRGTIAVDSVENRGTTFRVTLSKKIQYINGKDAS